MTINRPEVHWPNEFGFHTFSYLTADWPERLPMGEIKLPRPVLLVVAVFSRFPQAFSWAESRCSANWGSIALRSPTFEFSDTKFYEKTMGPNLSKEFWAFERLIDPASLVQAKIDSNAWEVDFQDSGEFPESRPLNLDPGYLTEAKFVLATTKDRDHRLYLDRGIFAECTLFYQRNTWQPRPWTYPDYLRPEYHQFFGECRRYLRERYQHSE